MDPLDIKAKLKAYTKMLDDDTKININEISSLNSISILSTKTRAYLYNKISEDNADYSLLNALLTIVSILEESGTMERVDVIVNSYLTNLKLVLSKHNIKGTENMFIMPDTSIEKLDSVTQLVVYMAMFNIKL